jgi:hypothetical protein
MLVDMNLHSSNCEWLGNASPRDIFRLQPRLTTFLGPISGFFDVSSLALVTFCGLKFQLAFHRISFLFSDSLKAQGVF